MKIIFIICKYRNMWICKITCKANSLVGRIISALVPTILECSLSLLIKGIRKAAVLPEPVLEHAITSLPYIILGIALLWIGVGTLYPLALIAL